MKKRGSKHIELARTCIKQNKLEEASVHLLDALPLVSKAKLEQHKQLAETFNTLGCCWYTKEDFQKAKSNFQQAFDLDPDYLFSLLNLVAAHQALGELTQAELYLVQAMKRAANRSGWKKALASSFSRIGAALSEQSNDQKAKWCYQQAVELAPSYQNYLALAELCEKLGKLGEVELHLNELLERASSLDWSELASFFNRLGLAWAARDSRQKALLNYQQAVKLNPKEAAYHVNLAINCMEEGELEEAEVHLTCALQAAALDADIQTALAQHLNHLGVAWASRGELQKAKVICQLAVKLNSDDALLHKNLSNICQDLGEFNATE